jgi:hypothetical protein
VILRRSGSRGKLVASCLRQCEAKYRHFFGDARFMGHRKKREPGPQRHAEGQHGERTHRRFIEQVQGGSGAEKRTEGKPVEGHHRLHQDRQQHDEAEKNSEKVEAMREVQRGQIDDNVLSHARLPHEGDSR